MFTNRENFFKTCTNKQVLACAYSILEDQEEGNLTRAIERFGEILVNQTLFGKLSQAYNLDVKTLDKDGNIDCEGCVNCTRCFRCTGCRNCEDCYKCHNCSNCLLCWACENCYNCKWSSFCIYCRNCNSCDKCRGCIGCIACKDFTTCNTMFGRDLINQGPCLE